LTAPFAGAELSATLRFEALSSRMTERNPGALDYWVFGAYALSALALYVLSPVLLIWTWYYGYMTSFPALLLSLFIPVGPQLFYIWEFWGTNNTLANLFIILCSVWIVAALMRLIIHLWINMVWADDGATRYRH
jgi:hypothetical protein